MANDEIINLIIRIAEEKEENEPLHVSGLESIHPMYEALIALLKQNLNDASIAQRFAKNPDSLREVLVVDGMLPFLRPEQKHSLEKLLTQGAPLKEIFERGSLLIAEDRRVMNGEIIRNAGQQGARGYFFKMALPSVSPQNLYLSADELNRVQTKATKFKKYAIRGALIGTAALMLTGYYLYSNRIALKYAWRQYHVAQEIIEKEYTGTIFP